MRIRKDILIELHGMLSICEMIDRGLLGAGKSVILTVVLEEARRVAPIAVVSQQLAPPEGGQRTESFQCATTPHIS